MPVEPDTRLLSETELWQLAFDVVNRYDGELRTDKTPAAVTSMLLRLWGQLAEHLVDTGQLRDTHVELERLVHTLPAGPYQRDRGPSQWLQRLLATQAERAELVPLLDALNQRMREAKVMDFGIQMSSAARLASAFPQVGQDLRNRYRVVLLDEYQDTGHAQRIALSALFGGGVDDGLALTAVGDPIQSIYGWRGASATNLPRFTTDFPRSDGTPAPVLELQDQLAQPAAHAACRQRYLRGGAAALRCGARVALAPRRPARHRPLCAAAPMRAPSASGSPITWTSTISGPAPTASARPPPRCWCAATPTPHPSPMRCAPAESRSRSSAWPACCLIPEVADVVAMLRLVADPTAGAAAMRVLAGPRWRLGGRDIAALWRRALAIAGERRGEAPSAESIAMAAGSDADTACLADAISDPGPAGLYSAAGYRRITALATEVSVLRGHLGHSLPDLVAEVRRALGVDCEVRAAAGVSAGWTGAEHLDAFADVVAGYADRATAMTSAMDVPAAASVLGLLAYLDAAEVVENGLPPAALTVARDRVQVLTVHSAKGLEWQVVAVAHLSGGTFPSTASRSSWLTDAAELPPLLRGDRSSTGLLGVPVLDTSDVTNRKQLSDKIAEHRRQLDQRRIDEERRLLYVAITRAEDTLLVSGHHWGATGIKPRGPSDFLCELKEIIDRSTAAGDPCGVVEAVGPGARRW